LKRLNPLNHALLGAAATAFVAAPASADLNFFWTYSESGGDVTNTLNLISSYPGFTAAIFADPAGAATFNNADASLLPTATPGESYLGGGPQNPVVVGTAEELGGADAETNPASIGSVIDATWISDFDNGVFPTGDTNSPIFAGQFTIAAGTAGDYTIRISNAGDVGNAIDPEVVQFSGTMADGRFAQRLVGDANMDGTVDFLDLSTLAGSFGDTNVSVLDGDFNGDNVVDFLDLSALAGNFGAGSGASLTAGDLEAAGLGEHAAVLVPEPTSLALLALGGLFVTSRRRR